MPSPPGVPFRGGQCVGVVYDVNFHYNFNFQGRNIDDYRSVSVYGGVSEANWFISSDGLVHSRVYAQGLYGLPYPMPGYYESSSWQSAGVQDLRLVSITLVRTDGSPDNCGDPGQAYPPASLPPDWSNYNYPYTYNDGANINVPVVIAPISGKAEINFNIGEVSFKVDLGGISFGDDASPPSLPYPGLPGDIAEIKNDLEDIKRDLEDIKRNEDQKENPEDPEEDPELGRGETDYVAGSTVTGIIGLKYVRLQMSKLPDKAQFGNFSPTVYFGGWLEFFDGDFAYEREQINFALQQFTAPPGADGFAFSCANGAIARAMYYYKV